MAAADNDIAGLQQDIEIASMMLRLIDYSDRYEVTVQLWPKYHTIYLAKDGYELYSYGASDLKEVLSKILGYLDRINRKIDTHGKQEKGL